MWSSSTAATAIRACRAISSHGQLAVWSVAPDSPQGGNVIKQRVARPGGGRSGGYRTVIAFRASQRSVFRYGFAKNERDNIDGKELDDLKKLAKKFLNYTEKQIATAVAETELREVMCDDQDKE